MADLSWAYQRAHSANHMLSMCEMTLEEAKKRLELFEKTFPSVYELWSRQPQFLHDTMTLKGTRSELIAALEELSTGTQSASET